ncbi:ABC-type transporter, integral membrane subunit [Desulfofundulus kuznetsovii DSM 6115]|uniref:ABC-type transporter, integral membrane subunit n=1 Tax=Desulfofundulus kuznetsovii (strain DSM 6115 / VKM B-1805 / 17) TaxID=760568 RepID=A0AAU8PAC8_DESK7|nr:ABC-type transporter, integral membrane subunit [Desulfofundulus kuznetsovii DSM 6115]
MEYLFTIWVIVTLNFLLPRAMPGDPFLYMSADEGQEVARFSEEQRQYYLEYYGLDRPVAAQYLSYLSDLLRGNLGYSLYYNEPVSTIILRRLPWTTFLVIAAVLLSTVFGTILGSISAWYREKWPDKFLFFCMILLSEVPAFLLGLVLLFTFAAGWGLFPLSGAITHFANYSSWWEKLLDILYHAFLPVMALTIARLGGMYLLARNSMTTVLEKDYLRTARAKGLPQKRIIFRHALRNAMLPIVTRVFLSLGSLVGGAILVENVFAYPGLGHLMREAVMVHDYPLVQGIFLVVTICVLLANFLADLVYRKLDPRIGDYSGIHGG